MHFQMAEAGRGEEKGLRFTPPRPSVINSRHLSDEN